MAISFYHQYFQNGPDISKIAKSFKFNFYTATAKTAQLDAGRGFVEKRSRN